MKGAVSQIWAGLLSIVLGCGSILVFDGAHAAESETFSNPAVTAMGRGLAEWIVTGGYETMDLSAFHYDRFAAGELIAERAVI